MGEKRRVVFLIAILIAVTVTATGIAVYQLYDTAVDETRVRLIETAKSRARLIEAIARFDQKYTGSYPGISTEATLSQIIDAHERFTGFGETGEFTLARLENDTIVFILRHRHRDVDKPQPIPFNAELAEPMRRALSGKSGSTIGLDYRGATVMAAYEPVDILNIGIVAKIDLAEIRAPFIRSSLTAGGGAVFAIFLGAMLFIKVTDPMIKNIIASETRYRGLFETISGGVAVYEAVDNGNDFIFRDFNHSAEKIENVNRSDLIGKRVTEVFPGVRDYGIFTVFQRVWKTGIAEFLPASEYKDENRSGRWRENWVYKLPSSEIVAIYDDVTERELAKIEREQLEISLRQQQKLESIGTLAGGVAHEINNPINGIMNYAQLIDDRLEKASPLHEYAQEIIEETNRISTIVRNLLTFARLDKESHSPSRIIDIIQSTKSLISAVIRSDQIELAVEVPDDVPIIKCRSQQIQQVLMNLLTNARDALNQKYPGYDENKKISISVSTFAKRGIKWVRMTVEDRGTGIADNIRDRIFDPFFTTKERTKGTGLGLSISHGIMAEHRGKLTFDSKPGDFSRFHIDLRVNNGWSLKTENNLNNEEGE